MYSLTIWQRPARTPRRSKQNQTIGNVQSRVHQLAKLRASPAKRGHQQLRGWTSVVECLLQSYQPRCFNLTNSYQRPVRGSTLPLSGAQSPLSTSRKAIEGLCGVRGAAAFTLKTGMSSQIPKTTISETLSSRSGLHPDGSQAVADHALQVWQQKTEGKAG